MRSSTFSSTFILALIAGSEATRQPYVIARAPASSLLGLAHRDTDGYTPQTELCGDGNTCAEACGAGYEQCASNDSFTHCFNPTAGETCCSIKSGDSCEAGYYCAHDSNSETTCCPESMDLGACAAALDANGALTLDSSSPTTTDTTTTSTQSSTASDAAAATTTTTHTTSTEALASDSVTAGPSLTLNSVVQSSTSLVPTTTHSGTFSSHSSSSSSTSTRGASIVPGSGAGHNQAGLGLMAALVVALL